MCFFKSHRIADQAAAHHREWSPLVVAVDALIDLLARDELRCAVNRLKPEAIANVSFHSVCCFPPKHEKILYRVESVGDIVAVCSLSK